MVVRWTNCPDLARHAILTPVLLAADARSIWDRLDAVRRTQLLMALLALLLLGFLLVLLVLVGGRYVRRLARERKSSQRAADRWYERRPARSNEPDEKDPSEESPP